jgi:hypothetical protein
MGQLSAFSSQLSALSSQLSAPIPAGELRAESG